MTKYKFEAVDLEGKTVTGVEDAASPRGFNFRDRRVDSARQLRMRQVRFGNHSDVGAITSRPQRNCLAETLARARHKRHFILQ